MQQNKTLSWQIGAAYIGTVIGAGFASGQEIMQFFTCYGSIGIFTIILSGILFMLLGSCIFYTSAKLKAYNYKDYIVKLCGHKLGMAYDIIITLFLFLGTSIMFSGSGAVFEESLQLPKIYGILAIAALTLAVVLQSLKGILRINSFITPALVIVTLTVLVLVVMNNDTESFMLSMQSVKSEGIIKPFFSFVFYCSYNIVLALGVLLAFPEKVTDQGTLTKGAIIGGIGLLVLALSLNTCLLLSVPHVFSLSIPMLYIVKGTSKVIQYAVLLCIWLEIFTTTVSNVFGLSYRLSRSCPRLFGLICTTIVLFCVPLAMVNFQKLVSIFYPLFGALSIFLILQIFYSTFMLRTRKPALKVKASRV